MKLKKVRIVIVPLDDVLSEFKRALKGEVRSIQKPGVLIFTSLSAAAKVLSPVRLEMLGTIVKEKPESIYALAKMLNRDFKNVYADVRLLEEVGLLSLKSTGKRDAMRPVAKYNGIEMDLAA